VCDDGGFSATCDNNCTPQACGDLTVNPAAGEECDDGDLDPNDACKNDCTLNVCGDGVIRTGVEECDDGNTTSGDGCSSTCQNEP
jgi:cysteine-rich repeat protein